VTTAPRDPGTEAFLLQLVQALHRHGLPAHRIEDALVRVGRKLGVELQVFSVPTGLTLGVGRAPEQRVFLLRVRPGTVRLARIAALSELIEGLVAGELGIEAARARLSALEQEPPPHGPWATAAAFALASAASAVFFHASGGETALSGLIGLVVGLLSLGAQRRERTARLFPVVAAALAAFLTALAERRPIALGHELVTLAAIIVLVPGYTLTVAVNELASGHLSSGTARLGGAVTTLSLLVCGGAAGSALASFLPAAPGRTPAALPGAAVWVALCVAPLAFQVLFQARHRDAPWIWLAAVLAFLCARLGSHLFGPLLGAGGGALALGLFSNSLARWRRLPAGITSVPGLLVLVPGSIGYRGIASVFTQETAAGLDLVAHMLAVALMLVCGLLLAGVLLPSQRSL
jgi:uncharacterized membrane protein YjjP (DUF1212 family)